MLKIAVFAPMPSASVNIAIAVNPAFFLRSIRAPYQSSCQSDPMCVASAYLYAPRPHKVPPAVFYCDESLGRLIAGRPQLNWIECQPSKLDVGGSNPSGRATFFCPLHSATCSGSISSVQNGSCKCTERKRGYS